MTVSRLCDSETLFRSRIEKNEDSDNGKGNPAATWVC